MTIIDLIKQVAQGVVDNAGQTRLGFGALVSPEQVQLLGEPAARPCKIVVHPAEQAPKPGDTVAVLFGPDGCVVLGQVD